MPDVVICGAGIAGVSAAYHLAVRRGVRDVVLVDEREPLTLTSDKGTEAYRNWWPGPGDTMVRFMNRSIDLLEELAREGGNNFRLNRRGYVFLTASPAEAAALERQADEISALGAGPVRRAGYVPSPAEGLDGVPDGADLLGPEQIREHFPFVNEDAIAALHVRRCGWMDAKRLGRRLLASAEEHGAALRRDRVVAVDGRTVSLASGDRLDAGAFVVAAGPHLAAVGALVGVDIPVCNELHGKMAIRDPEVVVPRDAPMMIWNDAVGAYPPGLHFRPRGEDELLGVWTYDARPTPPVWPPRFDPAYGDVLLKGLQRMVPRLAGVPGLVDGGYYCKTRENRPLIGPLPADGTFVIGALSGYGIMGSQAAGELLAAHVTGSSLPDYAPAFLLERYDDPEYSVDTPGGQL